MFKYLGDLLAYQEAHGRCITLDFAGRLNSLTAGQSCDGDVLFQVSSPPLRPQLTATFDGVTHGVGRRQQCSLGVSCDHSAEVMNVLSLLLGMNTNPKDLPVAQNIQLIP